jgi:hypothetical protein
MSIPERVNVASEKLSTVAPSSMLHEQVISALAEKPIIARRKRLKAVIFFLIKKILS